MTNKTMQTVFSAFMLALGLFMMAYTYSGTEKVAVGAGFSVMFYPRIVLWCWLLLAAGMLVNSIWFLKNRQTMAVNWRPLLIAVLLIGLVCGFLEYLGFIPTSFFFVVFYALNLGYRRPLTLMLSSAAFTLLVWYSFNNILDILLPTAEIFGIEL